MLAWKRYWSQEAVAGCAASQANEALEHVGTAHATLRHENPHLLGLLKAIDDEVACETSCGI